MEIFQGICFTPQAVVRPGGLIEIAAQMALSALDCPNGYCHSHHGGHNVNREEVEQQLSSHGQSWCERVAERTYEIAVDSFSQMVMPSLNQQGWQRRHLDWEFKLSNEPAEVERTVVDGTINALESFLRSREVQRLFVEEVVQGTLAEASKNNLRSVAIRYIIEKEISFFSVNKETPSSTASARPCGRRPMAIFPGPASRPARA